MNSTVKPFGAHSPIGFMILIRRLDLSTAMESARSSTGPGVRSRTVTREEPVSTNGRDQPLARPEHVPVPHASAGLRAPARGAAGPAPSAAGNWTQWLDVWYEAFNTVVELDGRMGHTEEGRFRDHRRDNITTVRGCDSLRYGWADTVDSSCQVAAEVAHVLRANGWDGHPRPCGSRCTAGRSAA